MDPNQCTTIQGLTICWDSYHFIFYSESKGNEYAWYLAQDNQSHEWLGIKVKGGISLIYSEVHGYSS